MAERIPRVGDRLADVPPGWVVCPTAPPYAVMVMHGRRFVSTVDGYAWDTPPSTWVVEVLGRFVDGEWQPHEPPVKDLPPGTQVHLTGGGCWVVVDDRSGRRFARGLRTDAIRNLRMDEVISYRNDDTNWEWVEA